MQNLSFTAKRRTGRRAVASLIGVLSVCLVVPGVVLLGTHSSALAQSDATVYTTQDAARPVMCRPEPPYYPGCTLRQTQQMSKARAIVEARARADYRTYGWGWHHRPGTLKNLSKALDVHLVALYRRAVTQFKNANGGAMPMYPAFQGFRTHAFGLCTENSLLKNTPMDWCPVWADQGSVANRLLWATDKLVLGCGGRTLAGSAVQGGLLTHLIDTTVGFWKAGAIAWGVNTGACVANHVPVIHHLWEGVKHWFSSLLPKRKEAEANYDRALRIGTCRMKASRAATLAAVRAGTPWINIKECTW